MIGGGPGGYVAAIKAAQLGLKTTCIEGRGTLGGTCLNVGCIPSKALLHSSHMYHEAGHNFAKRGIKIQGLELDLGAMMGQKNKAVTGLTKGIEFLFNKNKVTYVKGWGSFKSANEVEVSLLDGGKQSIKAKNVIIATGSDVAQLPGVPIDEKQIVSSTGALDLTKVPESMVVIGGGVIGLEMGSVWNRLGSKVTVVEFMDKIVPGVDSTVRTAFQRSLQKQGFAFKLSKKVSSAKVEDGKVKLVLEPAKGDGASEELEAEVVLVSTGRKPYTEGLGLDKAGVQLDERGRIPVDGHFRTNAPGVYAIGDVVPGPMLAHKAEEDGVAAVEFIANGGGHVNYDTVPGIIYTWPEVAAVGKTEDELKAAGIKYKVGTFPFAANSRAKAIEDAEGMVKVIAEDKTDRVLGVHIFGPNAGELIQECVLAMEYGASSEDIARTCHGHPTMSEAVKEAALATCASAIHA